MKKLKVESEKWKAAMQKMLRAFFIVLSLSTFNSQLLTAQHYVGLKGGYGAAQGRFHTSYGAPHSSLVMNKYTGGVMWKYYSDKPVVGGIGVELEFQQRGYRIYDNGRPESISVVISDTTAYRVKTRTVSSVTLPLVWQPHLYMMNRRVRLFLSAGVTFTYNTGVNDTWTVMQYDAVKTGEEHTFTTSAIPYRIQTARDVRWNYGWLGGAGIGVLMGRWEIFAEGRYYYGMSDILRTKTKYQFNEEVSIRSELDNIYITMGVYFRLGKGGITEPPLRRQRAVPVGDDDFRNIK